MRAAHARIQPFEEADPPFDSEDVEWACAEGLARLDQVMRAIQDLAPGHCRIAVEGATEKAGALLLGMRAIALVLLCPLADDRGEIRSENVDWPAHSAIGFLLALLDELTPEAHPCSGCARTRADGSRAIRTTRTPLRPERRPRSWRRSTPPCSPLPVKHLIAELSE